MKEFTRENFEKFIASEPNHDQDDHYSTSQERASEVFSRFLKWLEEAGKPKSRIELPVRQGQGENPLIIVDARGKTVAEASMIELVEPLVKQLNTGYRPNTEDDDERVEEDGGPIVRKPARTYKTRTK